jgi:hypothetical protein
MVQYSRENNVGSAESALGNQQWSNFEIRNRLMNNAQPMHAQGYSVFEIGAGYADVLAAIQADTVVSVFRGNVILEEADLGGGAPPGT